MTTRSIRWTAALALSALALASLAPLANAGPGWERRWKGAGHSGNGWRHTRVVVRDHSSSPWVPALAGLVGGFVLGSAVSSHSAPSAHGRVVYGDPSYGGDRHYAPAPERACYYDPYTGRRYTTLAACGDAYRSYGGPRMVERIDLDTGRCCDRFAWDHGTWVRLEVDSGYDNQGYRDDRYSYDRDVRDCGKHQSKRKAYRDEDDRYDGRDNRYDGGEDNGYDGN